MLAQMPANECVSHAEVVAAVADGELVWVGAEPFLPSGYCYTRADYEAVIQQSGVEWSGIAPGELMTAGEMLAYAVTPPPPDPPPTAAGDSVSCFQPQFTGGPITVSAVAANPAHVGNYMRVWEVRRNRIVWQTASTINQSSISVDGSGLGHGAEIDARVYYVSQGETGTPSAWSDPIYYRA